MSNNSAPEIILRDHLKKIFIKLEAEGCPSQGIKKNKVEIAKEWLREIIYPWEKIKTIATPTDKIGPVVLPTLGTLGMDSRTIYLKSVKSGSYIKFEVHLKNPGYLTLWEKNNSGKMWCLSPSFLAPSPLFPAGIASLPQEGGYQDYFNLIGTGVEEIIAAIAPEPPRLNWLPKPKEPPLELQKKPFTGVVSIFGE